MAEYTDLDAKDRGAADMRRRTPRPPGWELGCDTRLSMRVQVPRDLCRWLPLFSLGGAFSIIASAVMAAILPKFAEFVAADYARWARGEDRSARGQLRGGEEGEEDDAGDGVVQF